MLIFLSIDNREALAMKLASINEKEEAKSDEEIKVDIEMGAKGAFERNSDDKGFQSNPKVTQNT